MKILGIHIGHDSSAALIVDGRIIADVAEERFTRTKHYAGLPIHSIAYCLRAGGITIKDIDAVAVPTAGFMPELNYLLALDGDRREKRTVTGQLLEQARRVLGRSLPHPPLYIKQFPLPAHTPIVHVEHHLAHAASAYYTSGTREKQLIVTLDGAGDGYSSCIWRGKNGKIEPLLKLGTHASLGWFYSNVTEALGWWHGDGEGKTMGLAPFGDYTRCQGALDRFYPKFSNGNLAEPHDFGQAYHWNEGGALQWHYDEAYEIRALIEKYGREHIAAAAQRILEEQVMEFILPWLEREQVDRLSCAGGVFLNVKLNQRIWESGKVKMQHIFPNAGDGGLAAGAALYAYYQANPNAPIHRLEHLYFGPSYSDEEIEKILKARNLTYRRSENPSAEAAQMLANGKIVAWFQGRMESGPRALGNRSILMSANDPKNKDIINARVKFREAFRPFCPSLLEEYREDYLCRSRPEEFMITSFDVRSEKRDKVPAVVHVDGTARPQTVRREVNPDYWELIKRFGDLTGEYLVLNTSFNIKGEPIINKPSEAIRCLYDSGIDALVLGSFVLEKGD